VTQLDDTVLIPLRRRDGSIRAYAIVDAVDAEWVNQWRWSLHAHGYAMSTQRGRKIPLHRALLGLSTGDGLEGDHINRNKLDYRRVNLRAITKKGNSQNVPSRAGSASQYRGVSRSSSGRGKPWLVRVGIWTGAATYHHYGGAFDDEAHAAAVARFMRAQLLPDAID